MDCTKHTKMDCTKQTEMLTIRLDCLASEARNSIRFLFDSLKEKDVIDVAKFIENYGSNDYWSIICYNDKCDYYFHSPIKKIYQINGSDEIWIKTDDEYSEYLSSLSIESLSAVLSCLEKIQQVKGTSKAKKLKKYGVSCTMIYNGYAEVEAADGDEALKKIDEALNGCYGDDFPNAGKFGKVDFIFGEVTADDYELLD